MISKQEIDKKYLDQANALEAEFFDIVDQGLPSQHRVLKLGKTIEDFNLAHGLIWRNHEAELIAGGFMEAPIPPEPPLSTHLAKVVAINPSAVKPATVTRTWEGKEYTYDCFVSESVKDQWQAGDIAVGDFVLVHFGDIGEQIVTGKVFKSW